MIATVDDLEIIAGNDEHARMVTALESEADSNGVPGSMPSGSELVAELEQPGTYAKPGRPAAINRELSEARRRLAELNPAWEREATRLAELE